MSIYKLTVDRTITVTQTLFIEGDSAEDARERFQHQLESEKCSEIESEDFQNEFLEIIKFYTPYHSEYDVIDTELKEE